MSGKAVNQKFATDLLEKGANIRAVQELLGHENSATTEIYLSVTDLGLRRALAPGSKPIAVTRLAEIAEAWRPWRAYAAMALWMSQTPELTDPVRNAGER